MKDNIEVEYKFAIKNRVQLEEVVGTLDYEVDSHEGYSKKPRTYEKNVMYDNLGKSIYPDDARLRVRTKGEDGAKVFTYKKPLPPENGAKREIEYEIKFDDSSEQIEKILEAVYFEPKSSYERYRTEWVIGNVHVTLDEYPFGDFVEIEGEQSLIEAIAEDLGFKLEDGLTKPADTLFQEWRKERGLPFAEHMTFDSYDK